MFFEARNHKIEGIDCRSLLLAKNLGVKVEMQDLGNDPASGKIGALGYSVDHESVLATCILFCQLV
jgi:hypothetical protein